MTSTVVIPVIALFSTATSEAFILPPPPPPPPPLEGDVLVMNTDILGVCRYVYYWATRLGYCDDGIAKIAVTARAAYTDALTGL